MKTIYYNGTVYTGTMPLVQAFAVEDGKFVFTGSSEEAKAMALADDQLVDLQGKFVCSGFNDSHMHMLGFGNSLNAARLDQHTTSLRELQDCLGAFEQEHPHTNGAWLLGRGWNQDYFSDADRMPNRYDLDQVSKEVPICAVRACGHCLVVNSRALELLGVGADTPEIEGGRIGMENGELDGRFYDNAMDLVYDAIPAPDKETVKDMLRLACRALNSYGVTSSQTDDYCAFRKVSWKTINEAYRELERDGELTVRVYEQSNFTDLESLKEFVEAGNKTGVGSEYFKIGPLKMLGDGALGARTAYL
ncbi:MAG: amidohydrolase family protein, partial [Fusicatenibacter sp.]|nr:amidohydrolase family protein [Fusicatenibacter sp.]